METLTHQLKSDSAEQTLAFGRALGRLLQPGDFIGLVGELGAGKTQLSRGIAQGADVPEGEVASPTFAIVYAYQGRIPLYHADLYRLSDYDELYATGFNDLVGADGAMVVEWLDRVPEAAPADHLLLRLSDAGDSPDARLIHVTAYGPSAAARLREWTSALAQTGVGREENG